jgi:hypothetical protein
MCTSGLKDKLMDWAGLVGENSLKSLVATLVLEDKQMKKTKKEFTPYNDYIDRPFQLK